MYVHVHVRVCIHMVVGSPYNLHLWASMFCPCFVIEKEVFSFQKLKLH